MIDRRRILAGLCAAALPATRLAAAAKPGDRPLAALLLPLTGTDADLGRSLWHAALMAVPGATAAALPVFDTGSTATGAAGAATAAIRRGVPMIVGPVFAAEAAAVVAAAAASRVPVVALSNDAAAAAGSFVLGITPSQLIGAVLGYARGRGVRRVGLVAGGGRWGLAAAAAAAASASRLGLDLRPFSAAAEVDAVLVAGDAATVAATARAVGGTGVQLLGTCQGMASGAGPAEVDGAWFAAPDPAGFTDFSRHFETAYGNPPGQLAGLAYDAVGIARTLRAGGHAGRDGLLASAGFAGVTGGVRFDATGAATRELAIVVVRDGGYATVARSLSA